LLALVLWIHLGDLLTAWVYYGGAVPEVAYARLFRDMSVLLAACACLATTRMATSILLSLLIYGALVLLSLGTSATAATSPGIVLGSFGTLLIPLLFFLVGYYCIRDYADLRALVGCIVTIACLSAIFGVWDIDHTDFWIQTVRFPAYMTDVKGMVFGAEPDTGLPWNFFSDLEKTRRAAGLLAAPLAQGMFLAVAGLLVLATSRGGLRLLGVLICVGLCVGVWMTATRGAMLVGTIAVAGYLMTDGTLRVHKSIRIALAILAVLVIIVATQDILEATAYQTDGSSPGHWAAFWRNIEGLPQIPLLGYGVGMQGPIAAQGVILTIGGGEGAIFSVAYQIGIPAAVALLSFYVICLIRLWRAHRDYRSSFALATFWLMVGFATTLVTSDHLLAVSGSASLWLLTGGGLRLLSRAQGKEHHLLEAHA
jgi:D-xylose transport system permease protein